MHPCIKAHTIGLSVQYCLPLRAVHILNGQRFFNINRTCTIYKSGPYRDQVIDTIADCRLNINTLQRDGLCDKAAGPVVAPVCTTAKGRINTQSQCQSTIFR
ncbi:hypothetical protein D3C72_1833070 [compost metagenome]